MSFSLLFISIEAKAHDPDFFCGSKQGIPTTIARTERGNIPVIYWITEDLPGNLTPQSRCEQVSNKLQAAQDHQRLKYLSSGILNGQPVICTSDKPNGNCIDILFTLLTGSDPKHIINYLDLRGLANGRAIEQGNDEQTIYIDFSEYLSRIPSETE